MVFFVSASIASAATAGQLSYTPLEPFDAWHAQAGAYSDFAFYLNTIFKLLITLGSLFAVVMLVIAGIGYMVSEAAVDIEKAKQRARAALWGLLLLTGCWLILYTINPDLLKFNLNIPMAPGGTYTGGSSMPGGASQPNSNSTPCGNNTTGCPSGSYCSTTSLIAGNSTTECLQNTSQAANKDCTDSGGSWYRDLSGEYCYLSAAKNEGECNSAGGKWQSRWLTTSYCYK